MRITYLYARVLNRFRSSPPIYRDDIRSVKAASVGKTFLLNERLLLANYSCILSGSINSTVYSAGVWWETLGVYSAWYTGIAREVVKPNELASSMIHK